MDTDNLQALITASREATRNADIEVWTVGDHTMSVHGKLDVGERKERFWTCTCSWKLYGFDTVAKAGAAVHKREVKAALKTRAA